jgi:hypothetical protein
MKQSSISRILAYLTVLVSIFFLTGCDGRSVGYLLTRAYQRLSTPPEKQTVLEISSTPVPTKLVTLQSELSTLPVGGEKTTQTANERAIAAIRVFVNQQSLSIAFQKEVENPDTDLRKTSIYLDDLGADYWIDEETMQIVKWTPKVAGPLGREITIDQLRLIAIEFARKHSPEFNLRFDRLILTQLTQGGVAYTFRWEDQSIAGPLSRPFLEVVLRPDGLILSYQNTLDILKK